MASASVPSENISASLHTLAEGGATVLGVRIVPSLCASARRPFHLALLLDTSGSMSGVRIDTVKRTLHLLIDALALGDTLTLIKYNSVAKQLRPPTVISEESRPLLRKSVDGLSADGGTNLESAFTVLRDVTGVDAVFVLTDGHVNQGITAASGLQRLAEAAVVAGTPLNTLGYGAEHNSRLLRDIAMRSRGTYTFADAAEMIPAIIGDIVAGLADEVGRNAVFRVPTGWRVLEVDGSAEGVYRIGTLIAEKPQWVVLERTDAGSEVPTIHLEWICAGGGTGGAECAVTDALNRLDVAEQRDRARVATTFRAVSDMLETGGSGHTTAVDTLVALQNTLGESPAHDTTLVIRLRAQIDEMLEMLRMPPAPTGLAWAYGGVGWGLPAAPLLSRLASNTVALGMQRGVLSGCGQEQTFSSPAQRRATTSFVTHFSQQEDPESNP